ncbi:Fe-S-cluster containining protein [Formivibrio citricus]|uniref:Fe-S-cluster containining protein n=1 Tax=Formivibrio citricus TaxID=83765 RepID=A0A1I5BUL7_9NEIS|nr:YkgJ family cysteine cluster protein [Formivibrio citricus]SFN78348.1 Fe-S-cluster containining protein [Formivibrio citricus]
MNTNRTDLLVLLHRNIDERVQSIRDTHSDWLCGKGCDGCCRRLAEVPLLTEAEWLLLREGLAQLSGEDQTAIALRVAALADQTARPLTCPMLDERTNACPVYPQRPVACRTYGFYVQRDLGLYCREIESRVAAGELANVIWGNHDVINQRLSGLGLRRTLIEWFASSKP